MSAGEVIGFDLSIGVSVGYAMADKKRDFFNQIQNKEAAKKYDDAKKTVTNTVTDAAGNLIDNVTDYMKDW